MVVKYPDRPLWNRDRDAARVAAAKTVSHKGRVSPLRRELDLNLTDSSQSLPRKKEVQ